MELKTNKMYWRGVEELEQTKNFTSNADKEFPGNVDEPDRDSFSLETTHRRDFLKVLGFGVAAASLAACEAPVRKAIPYLNKPEDVDPSVSNFYASSVTKGGDYASVLVKTREGRPIKIEPNPFSPITGKGTCARIEASVLSLYDNNRLKGPKAAGASVSWEQLDAAVVKELKALTNAGGKIRIVTNTVISPSALRVFNVFKGAFPGTEVVTYDAVSYYSLIQGNQLSFNKSVIPSYDFTKAKTIVSFDADFLGTWLSPIEFSTAYASTRKVSATKQEMSKHYQFETLLSLTGASADYREAYLPSASGLYVATLHNMIARATGGQTLNVPEVKESALLEKAAKDLLKSKGKSIVVSSSKDANVQVAVNAINSMLGNYEGTINLNVPVKTKQGDDSAFADFVSELNSGKISGVIFHDCNPVYNHPMGKTISSAIAKSKFTLSFTEKENETTGAGVKYIAPINHYLESWGDAEPKSGLFSFQQPAIAPLFKTRQAEESLLKWTGYEEDYYAFLKNTWKNTYFHLQSEYLDFEQFWNRVLHDGVFVSSTSESSSAPSFAASLSLASSGLSKGYTLKSTGTELVAYEKVSIGDGTEANNPWLQEMPDPVSKACWDNYAAVSIRYAADNGLKQDDMVKVSVNGASVELPVLIQPGLAYGAVAIAIGYGRTFSGKVCDGIGVNIYPLLPFNKGVFADFVSCTLEKGEGTRQIAQTQTHNTIMGRPVIQETTLAEFKKDPYSGRYRPEIATSLGKKAPETMSLWEDQRRYQGHLWGLAIDLNSCNGCNACVISCQAENNVSVVGRQEVINRREMHWIRIDRYYSSEANPEDKSPAGLKALEEASDNPKVVFQPMLCQHCNNAPCETVCPVLATTHSSEGLNQMAYNRCFGTRYCANNCPYKVRRFNWFSYYSNKKFENINPANLNNTLGRMVLNPDVTVRARGVMEKCSLCVQRIQAGKLQAKKEKRKLKDGDIVTACQSACATGAIVFGDMNDTESSIYSILNKENKERSYHVLEELNVRPNVNYLLKVTNRDIA